MSNFEVLEDNNNNPMCYEKVSESARYLLDRTKWRPKIAIICGSGLAGLGEGMENAEIIPYQDIPNFPVSTAPGHKSSLVFGTLNKVPVMLMQGRFHLYEGYSLHICAMPVRVMKIFGVKAIIISNAAGGLADNLNVGDIMLIKDHVNIQAFVGINPLRGLNHSFFGPRFFSMVNAYDAGLLNMAKRVAKSIGIEDQVKEGIYTMMGGPSYETPAELKLLKNNFVDAVGMSTVHEVVTARHAGMKILSFSLITNVCKTSFDGDLGPSNIDIEQEVSCVAEERGPVLKNFLSALVTKMQREF